MPNKGGAKSYGQEDDPRLSGCARHLCEPGRGKVLWVNFSDPANFPTAKNVYAGLLLAHYTGRKLNQIVFSNPATTSGALCHIRSIRSGP